MELCQIYICPASTLINWERSSSRLLYLGVGTITFYLIRSFLLSSYFCDHPGVLLAITRSLLLVVNQLAKLPTILNLVFLTCIHPCQTRVWFSAPADKKIPQLVSIKHLNMLYENGCCCLCGMQYVMECCAFDEQSILHLFISSLLYQVLRAVTK